jgi:CheY-like chemotaxis protein
MPNADSSHRDLRPILYAEDSGDDAFLMERAFRKANFLNQLKVVYNGQQAIDYLAGKALFADRAVYPMPAMVLLDLKMPQKTGLEVLQWIRGEGGLHDLTVFLLSSSNLEKDIASAYRLGANGYLVKPMSLDGMLELVSELRDLVLRGEKVSGWTGIKHNQLRPQGA